MASKANQSGVAVVVGVGPGLGAALAHRFADGGYSIAMIARSREFIEDLAARIGGKGGRAMALTADTGDAAQVSRTFDTIRTKFEIPEVLLYNAGSAAWARSRKYRLRSTKMPGESTHLARFSAPNRSYPI